MFSRAIRFAVSVIMALSFAQLAKADDMVFSFTDNTTIGAPITAKGSFTADFGSPSPAGLDWDITFSSQAALDLPLELTKKNSLFTIFPNTNVSTYNLDGTTNVLSIAATDVNGGFDLSGTATSGGDQFLIDWRFGGGVSASLITISVPNSPSVVGEMPLTSPPTFEASAPIVGTSPVPEPSSLLLFGTGSLSAAIAGFLRFRSAPRKG